MLAHVAPPKRQLRVSTRSLPKHLAGRLQERVERMRDDPAVLLPECRHEGGCPRASLERRLRRVQKAADSRGGLRRLARRGTPLARGYAGALDLLFDDATPMLAGFPSPFGGGEVKFAQRGNAKKEIQAGVQNYTDKGLRLLAYLPYARGFRGAYLFSTEGGLLCTGRSPAPPAEFLGECAAAERPALSPSKEGYACPHLKDYPAALPREADETHLAAKWRESPAVLRLCVACAGAANLSLTLRKFAIGPKVADQIESWVELRPQCREAGKQECHFDGRVELSEEEREAFHAGKLTDEQVLAKVLKRAMGDLERGGDGFVLAGGVCQGSDHAALLAALGADTELKRALKAALDGLEHDVVLDALTASKLLSKFWGERGKDILAAACGDEGVARRVVREAKENEAPATLVQRAVKLARAEAVETALPSFGQLSDEAALADRVARAFRRGGTDAALREVEAGRTKSPAAGAVAWAFLAALDKAGGREWQFTKVETDRGANARELARDLLDCRADDYARALVRALEALGIHERIEVTTT